MRHQLNQKVKQTNCRMKTNQQKAKYIFYFAFYFCSSLACCSTPSATKTVREKMETRARIAAGRGMYREQYTTPGRGLLHFEAAKAISVR